MTRAPDTARDSTPSPYDAWASYYDIGEGDRMPFLQFYQSLLQAQTRSVLEIGCGTGILASAMRQQITARGLLADVAGVDLSEPMLAIARDRDPLVRWYRQDMRELDIEGRFDLVFCCFNTFQFMLADEDLLAAFRAAHRHTQPGGRFAFDLYQPNLAYLAVPRKDSLARSVIHGGRELQIREDTVYTEGPRLLDIDWRLVAADAPEHTLARTHFRIRQYFASDIERLLALAGWQMLERYGGLDRSGFGPAAKKQVLVCAPA